MSKGLTRRQQQIMDFISAEVDAKGYPPSVREIGSAVGLSSSSTVHSHLTALERKGRIKRDPSKPRALLLSDRKRVSLPDRRAHEVPLLGHVAAGEPILADENVEDRLCWPQGIGAEPTFALKVRGDSMIDDGIHDGDVIMVRKQQTAENSEIVVAMIDGEATVKRFFREPGRTRLEAANPAYEPIYSSEVVILGKVIGLMRSF